MRILFNIKVEAYLIVHYEYLDVLVASAEKSYTLYLSTVARWSKINRLLDHEL